MRAPGAGNTSPSTLNNFNVKLAAYSTLLEISNPSHVFDTFFEKKKQHHIPFKS